MTEISPDSVTPPPASIPISPDARIATPGQKKAFKRNMFVMGGIVLAILLILFYGKATHKPVQNGSVIGAPKLGKGDPTQTPETIAQQQKDKDAENAEKVKNSTVAIGAGMSYVPAPTKEFEDPLAAMANTSDGKLAPVTAPKDAPMPAPVQPTPAPPVPQNVPVVPLPAGGPTAVPPTYIPPPPGAPPRKIESTDGTAGGSGSSDGMSRAMHNMLEHPGTASHAAMLTTVNETLSKSMDEAAKMEPGAKSSSGTTPAEVDKKESNPVLVRLGHEIYAKLDLQANSDSSKFVQASVPTGKFQGAIFQGEFTRDDETLEIKFDKVSFRGAIYRVTAIAVDPSDPKVGMATDVEHHYLTRFGGIFLAGFAKGFSTALTQSGQTVSVAGGSVSTFEPNRTTGQAATIGAGSAIANFGSIAADAAKRPITVIIAANTPVGILFTDDWVYDPAAIRKTAQIPSGPSTDEGDAGDLSRVPTTPTADVGGEPPRVEQ